MNPLEIKTIEEPEKPRTDLAAEILERQQNIYHTFQEAGRPFWEMYQTREEYRLQG